MLRHLLAAAAPASVPGSLWKGLGFALAAAVTHSGIDSTRKFASVSIPTEALVCLVALIDAAISCSVVAIMNGGMSGIHATISRPSAFYAVTITSSSLLLVAKALYQTALQLSPLSLTIPYLSFTPAILLVTAYLLLGEVPSGSGVAGVCIVAFGGFLLSRCKSPVGGAGSGGAAASCIGNGLGGTDLKLCKEKVEREGEGGYGSPGLTAPLLLGGMGSAGTSAASSASSYGDRDSRLDRLLDRSDRERPSALGSGGSGAGSSGTNLTGLTGRVASSNGLGGMGGGGLSVNGCGDGGGAMGIGLTGASHLQARVVSNPGSLVDLEAAGGGSVGSANGTLAFSSGLGLGSGGGGSGSGLPHQPLMRGGGKAKTGLGHHSRGGSRSGGAPAGHQPYVGSSSPALLRLLGVLGAEPGTVLMLVVAGVYAVTASLDKLGTVFGPSIWVYFALQRAIIASLCGTYVLAARRDLLRYLRTHLPILLAISVFELLTVGLFLLAVQHILVSYVVAIKRSNILMSVVLGRLVFKESISSRLPYVFLMLMGMSLIVLEPSAPLGFHHHLWHSHNHNLHHHRSER